MVFSNADAAFLTASSDLWRDEEKEDLESSNYWLSLTDINPRRQFSCSSIVRLSRYKFERYKIALSSKS